MFKNITSFLIIFFIIVYSSLVFCAGLNKIDPRYPLREYRKFILPNQMKVILISDPTLQRGSASMTVALGSMNDPEKSPGLAHFIEHMLFLGTEKYPEEGGYQKFISTHDGFSNAYTAEDRTNYHFEIDSNYLEEALDRFSQFFISPLFKNELLQREIRVIDEEHSKNIANDYRRILQVKRKAFSKDHPARHFANGTIETLKNVTREELITFYKKYYSSNQMMLVVAGPQNMNLLQDLVVNRFNKIKNNKVLEKLVSSKFMEKDPRFRLMQIKTIKDLRYLKLVFPLTKTLHQYKSRPLGMLGFLIGHEGYGSLLSLLKKNNLASNLSAGVGTSNKSFSSFEIDIQLTKKGIRNYKKVIENFFQYINLLRKEGLPRYIFKEVKLSKIIENKFDIIVGTQILSKGHNFPYLKTVGIINIDNLLNDINETLYKLGRPFGWRTYKAMMTYIANHPTVSLDKKSGMQALSDQVTMRIMPKLRGLDITENTEIFVESYVRPIKVVIVGAVHIAQYLVDFAKSLNFEISIIDPRGYFASEQRFPDMKIINKWPDEAFKEIETNENSALIALTHDPKIDDPALQHALNKKFYYIGALGSKKTHENRCQRLKEAGFDNEQINSIHGPIGIKLGGRSAPEIAFQPPRLLGSMDVANFDIKTVNQPLSLLAIRNPSLFSFLDIYQLTPMRISTYRTKYTYNIAYYYTSLEFYI